MLGTRPNETLPNKNVIQGTDLVSPQTKSGHPGLVLESTSSGSDRCVYRRADEGRAHRIRNVLATCFDVAPCYCEFAVRFDCEACIGLEVLVDFGFVKHSIVDAKFVDDAGEDPEFAIRPPV